MNYKPGDTYYAAFTTRAFDSGQGKDADSTPTVEVRVNGTADDWSLVVTKLATGHYKVTGTVAADLSASDVYSVTVTASVGNDDDSIVITDKCVIDEGVIDTKIISDLNDIAAEDILNLAIADYTDSGTLGAMINSNDANITLILADTDELQTNQGNWLTLVAGDIWDVAIADHLDSGTVGAFLNAVGDPWSTELPGSYTDGQAGYYLDSQISGIVSGDAVHVHVSGATVSLQGGET